MPPAGVAQRRRRARDHEGPDALRRRDRRRPVSRSRRHPLPHGGRAALVLDAVQRLRSAATSIRATSTARCRRRSARRQPYASFTIGAEGRGAKPLAGVARRHRPRVHGASTPPTTRPSATRSTPRSRRVLRDELGADARRVGRPDVPGRSRQSRTWPTPSSRRSPRSCRSTCRSSCSRRRRDGTLTFAVAGFDVTKRDYMVKAAEGQAPWPEALNMRSINDAPADGELRLPPRAVPAAARRRARHRLGDPERQREVRHRGARRRDEELGEQGRLGRPTASRSA